jgi:predicted transcriptional regulator
MWPPQEGALARPRADSSRLRADSSRVLEIRVGPPRDALDRFEAAWNRIADREKMKPLYVLSMADLPLLLKTLSPARWALLEDLHKAGPCSIYELARRLERDYKNVHTDVSQLIGLGVVERNESGVGVAWDVLRAELRLHA